MKTFTSHLSQGVLCSTVAEASGSSATAVAPALEETKTSSERLRAVQAAKEAYRKHHGLTMALAQMEGRTSELKRQLEASQQEESEARSKHAESRMAMEEADAAVLACVESYVAKVRALCGYTGEDEKKIAGVEEALVCLEAAFSELPEAK